jgi:Na+-translocating ferredoxin:NAD+ oxidoreductase subunit D
VKKNSGTLLITSSPQFHHEASTAGIMWSVCASLVPAALWGVLKFGLPALLVLSVSIIAAVAGEFAMTRVFKKNTLGDGSAVLTGFLLGMTLPPHIPLFIPAAGSLFAVLVVKWTFGGLGNNWMNPALAGRIFVFFSWPGILYTIDGTTHASPLTMVKAGLLANGGVSRGPLGLMINQGFRISNFDTRITGYLNANLFENLGIYVPGGYVDLFFGNTFGSIGEVSALLLLAGTVFLIARKIICWKIPLAYIGVFSFITLIFGGIPFGSGYFSGDVLFHLFSGGMILGAFFMATDPVTSPIKPGGMLLYGAGCGFLTYLLRFFGSFPDGFYLAIIVMNVFVPLIDRFSRSKSA